MTKANGPYKQEYYEYEDPYPLLYTSLGALGSYLFAREYWMREDAKQDAELDLEMAEIGAAKLADRIVGVEDECEARYKALAERVPFPQDPEEPAESEPNPLEEQLLANIQDIADLEAQLIIDIGTLQQT